LCYVCSRLQRLKLVTSAQYNPRDIDEADIVGNQSAQRLDVMSVPRVVPARLYLPYLILISLLRGVDETDSQENDRERYKGLHPRPPRQFLVPAPSTSNVPLSGRGERRRASGPLQREVRRHAAVQSRYGGLTE